MKKFTLTISKEEFRKKLGIKNPSAKYLTSLMLPLIPDPLPGQAPSQDYLLSLIQPLIPAPIKGDDGSPDTPEEILRKIRTLKKAWLYADDIIGLKELIHRPMNVGGTGAISLMSDVSIRNPTAGQVLKWNSESQKWENGTDTGGVSTFLELTDTPDTYVGQALKGTRVNAAETALEFYDTYSDEMAQDAVGAMIDSSLSYTDTTPLLKVNESYAHDWGAVQSFHTILGAEKINNPGFATDSIWTKTTGWAITGGVATHNANGTGTLSQASGSMVTPLVAGRQYEFTFTIKNYVSGTVVPACGGNIQAFTTRSANGTYTEKFIAQSTASLTFTPSNTSRFEIDDVSLKEISGGGVLATNTEPATLNLPGTISAPIAWHAKAWKSNAVAASQSVDFQSEVRGFTGASVVTSEWVLKGSINGGSYNDLLKIAGTGRQTTKIVSSVGETIGYEIDAPFGNSSPGTTRHIKFSNSASNTWLDFFFAGVAKSHIGADSNGAMKFYAGGGSYFEYYQMSGLSLFSYSYPTAFVHSGHGLFGGSVHAGNQSAPTSRLQSAGATAFKVERKVASFNYDNSASTWLLDGANAAACAGTASVACATYTNSTDCLARDAHGGCSWFAGNDCSVFNNESGMSSCSGQAGCSVSTYSCSGAGDQTSCEAQDDAYGGSCSWDMGTNTCPSQTNTTDCNNAGCSPNVTGDCGTLSDGGGDGTNCATQPECSYDSGSGTCSGSYFISCDGDNSTPSCVGNFNNGNCTGVYGAACSGTPSCASIDDSTSCGGETGCTWATVISTTLPQISTCPDRIVTAYNDDSGGADAVINAYAGETIEGASSVTLPMYGDSITLQNFLRNGDCSEFLTAGACTPTGCTINNGTCSWNSMDSTCGGNAVCTGIGDQVTCEATTYFSSCSGVYNINKDWKIISDNRSKSGTYTPTLYNTTNIAASTPRLATWMRVQNTVFVTGQLDIDPTATGAVLLGISLPIPSNFSTVYQLGGAGSSIGIANESYGLEADTTNDRASMKNIAVSIANHTVTYSFSYQIIS